MGLTPTLANQRSGTCSTVETAEGLVSSAPGAAFAAHLRLNSRARRNPRALRAAHVAHDLGRQLTGVPVRLAPMREAAEQIGDAEPDHRPSDEDCRPRHPVHAPLPREEVRLASAMTIS